MDHPLAHWPLDMDGEESRMMTKIIENWRPLMVLATVVWAVFIFAENGIKYSEDIAFVLGPFVIAMAIYFLFPKQKDQ